MSRPEFWKPKIDAKAGPLYRQIARALANDIRSGLLEPGERLPAQRDLAAALAVTVSTVTKAYKEVGRLNLVSGRARAGTHVVRRSSSVVGWNGARRDDRAMIDLSSNSVGTDRFLHELAAAIPTLSASERFADLQEYAPVAGHPHHRAVVARWLNTRGIQAEPDQIVITSGAHEGLAAVLITLASDGGTLLAEELTYAPLRPLARAIRLRVEAVVMDADGVDPADVESGCRRVRRPSIFLTPYVNNPTTATLSIARRQAIVATARRHDARIVEDDVFALLAERQFPSLAAMAPERVFHVSSFAKSVAPGLRMGFVRAPDRAAADRVASAVGLSTRMAPPLYAELACQWLVDGTIDRIVAAHRIELERRVRLARKELTGLDTRANRFGPHLWLRLPRGRAEAEAVGLARAAGVEVLGSREFSLRGESVDALRLTLAAPRALEDLRRGLSMLRGILI